MYLCSENKGADLLRSYCAADLHFCFRISKKTQISPALATCETSQVLLAGVSGGFQGVFPFLRTYRLARLDMSEIILKGTLN